MEDLDFSNDPAFSPLAHLHMPGTPHRPRVRGELDPRRPARRSKSKVAARDPKPGEVARYEQFKINLPFTGR